mmetsp:Transcript_14652/g.24591  ORF Transcript_14652/g.24591 Transcript_14652/m.24591 type:complete len:110 (-) Transcript_14652:15-344(-)
MGAQDQRPQLHFTVDNIFHKPSCSNHSGLELPHISFPDTSCWFISDLNRFCGGLVMEETFKGSLTLRSCKQWLRFCKLLNFGAFMKGPAFLSHQMDLSAFSLFHFFLKY